MTREPSPQPTSESFMPLTGMRPWEKRIAEIQECSRRDRDRDLRFKAIRIAKTLHPLRVEDGAREIIAWVDQTPLDERKVRLQCIDDCWTQSTMTIRDFLNDAGALLKFVTEADNG